MDIAGQTAKSKRPVWQLHLSTAVLLMLLAGVFLGFNMHALTLPGTQVANYSHPDAGDVSQRRGEFNWVFIGWPWGFYGEARWKNSGKVIPGITGNVFRGNEGLPLGLNYSTLLCDVFAWVVLLTLVGLVLEWRVRDYPRLSWPGLHVGTCAVVLCTMTVFLWINFGRLVPITFGIGWPQPFYFGNGSEPESQGRHVGNLLFDFAFSAVITAALTGITEVALRRRSRCIEGKTRIHAASVGLAIAATSFWIWAAATPGIAFFSYENWATPPPIYGFPFPMGTSPDGVTVKWLIIPSLVNGVALICGIVLVTVLSEAIFRNFREGRKP